MYDSALGRWHVADLMEEKYYSVSPYAYCAGNPVNAVDPDGRWIKLFEAFKFNSNASEVLTKRGISTDLRGALKDVLSTSEGYGFFAQFAKKGDRIAGHTFREDGKLSNNTLDIVDYSFSEENGNLTPSSDAGSIGIDSETGTVTLKINTYQLNSKEEIVETVDHETQIHGYKVKDGLLGKNVTNENQDHKALRDKDTNHKGYRQYKSMQKQLEKNDNKYKKEFKNAENHYKYEYENVK
jgi:hypothetical protein